MPTVELKEDTVEIKGLEDFSSILGCTALGDKYIHLGALFTRRTACGKSLQDSLLSRDVTVNCPECVAESKYRQGHPEAAGKQLGVVTHKESVGS